MVSWKKTPGNKTFLYARKREQQNVAEAEAVAVACLLELGTVAFQLLDLGDDPAVALHPIWSHKCINSSV